MNPTAASSGPGRWIPVRDRVTGRLLCEYDPHTNRIRVRRSRRYYTALLPPATSPAAAAHRLLHQLDAACPEGLPARGAHPEDPDDDRPDP